MKLRSLHLAVLAALFVSFAAGATRAASVVLNPPVPVTLDTLLGGSEFVVGDLKFSNFTYNNSETPDYPPADEVNVIGIINDGNYGLRFQAGFADFADGAVDTLITFDVMTLGGLAINDVHVAANPSTPTGGTIVVATTSDDLPRTLEIFDVDDQVQSKDWDFTNSPVRMLPIEIDIFVDEGVISFFDITFSRAIPAPAALPAGLAMLGLAAVRRRRRVA